LAFPKYKTLATTNESTTGGVPPLTTLLGVNPQQNNPAK